SVLESSSQNTEPSGEGDRSIDRPTEPPIRRDSEANIAAECDRATSCSMMRSPTPDTGAAPAPPFARHHNRETFTKRSSSCTAPHRRTHTDTHTQTAPLDVLQLL